MSGNIRRDLLIAVQPIADANSQVGTIVQDLARHAKEEPDPARKQFLLETAERLLGKVRTINESLGKVAATR